MARTYLRAYSIEVIRKSSDNILNKCRQKENNFHALSNARQIIWCSLKRMRTLGPLENLDPIIMYWIDENWDFFANTTRTYQVCYLILSNAVKEFNLRAKGIQNSINYELLL